MDQAVPHQVVLFSSSKFESTCWSRLLPMLRSHSQLQSRVSLDHFDAWAAVQTRRSLPWYKRVKPRPTEMIQEFQGYLERLPVSDYERSADLVFVAYRSGCYVLQRAIIEELTCKRRLDVLARVRRIIQLAPSRRTRYRWVFIATIATLIGASAVQLLAKLNNGQGAITEAVLVILSFLSALLLALAQFFGWTVKSAAIVASHTFVELIERGSKRKSGTWPISVSCEQVSDLSVADARDVADVVNKLIHPVPHPNVYEVREEEVNEVISPVSTSDIPPGLRPKIQTDHQIAWERRIDFQPYNITTRDSDLEPWALSLSTSGVLDVVSAPNGKNEWKSDEEWAYKTNRKKFLYRFYPQYNESYTLRLNVYGPHGPGIEKRTHTCAQMLITKYIAER